MWRSNNLIESWNNNALLFNEAEAKCSEITGPLSADTLRVAHQHQNRGIGFTKAQYIDVTMDFMEKGGVFDTQYEKWFDAAANVFQDDGSKKLCRLEQTCTPKGAENIDLIATIHPHCFSSP